MAKIVWVAALMVAVVLSGCVDDKKDADTAGDGDGGTGATAAHGPSTPPGPVAAPTWNIGDWWQYQVDYESGESYTAKVVVYDEDDSQYHVTADDRELILRAAFTHYPTIGAVSKNDLSQSIHDANVQYLRFPLGHDNWTGTFRDFPASYQTTPATLETGREPVDGFVTTIHNTEDGLLRLANGYSPEVGWFTNFTFDFDGVAPPDVTYTLQDWGTNHTGELPVLEVIDGVHRVFPTLTVAAPDPEDPAVQPPTFQESTDAMAIEAEGASLLWGWFAGAGGGGAFEFDLVHKESGSPPHQAQWHPSSAGSLFEWGEIEAAPVGAWDIICTGTAQASTFLFCETYEVRGATTEL